MGSGTFLESVEHMFTQRMQLMHFLILVFMRFALIAHAGQYL